MLFQIQTELAYLSKHKSELEEQMDDEELRQKREIIQLENEKVINALYHRTINVNTKVETYNRPLF